MFTVNGAWKESPYISDLKREFVLCGNRVCQRKLYVKMELLEHNLRMKSIKLLRIPEMSLKSSWVDILLSLKAKIRSL